MTKPGGKRRSWTGEVGPTKQVRKRNRGKARPIDKLWARMRLFAGRCLCEDCKGWTEKAINTTEDPGKRSHIQAFPHRSEIPVGMRARAGWALDAELDGVVHESSESASFEMLPDSGFLAYVSMDEKEADMPRWKERSTARTRDRSVSQSSLMKNWQRATEHAAAHDCDGCRRWRSARRAFMRDDRSKRAHLKGFPHPEKLVFGRADAGDVLVEEGVDARTDVLPASGFLTPKVDLSSALEDVRSEESGLSRRLRRNAERDAERRAGRKPRARVFQPSVAPGDRPDPDPEPVAAPARAGRPRVVLPVDEVLAMHDRGDPATAIAESFGCHRSIVARVLRENGRSPHRAGRRAKALPWDDVVRDYNAGDSLEQVGKRYGVAASTIHYTLKRHGVDRRRSTGATDLTGEGFSPQRQQVVDLHRRGLGGAAIARELGITAKRAYKHIQAAKAKVLAEGGEWPPRARAEA